MIGTTRTRVSLFMNKCRTPGLNSDNGKIEDNNTLYKAAEYEKTRSETAQKR